MAPPLRLAALAGGLVMAACGPTVASPSPVTTGRPPATAAPSPAASVTSGAPSGDAVYVPLAGAPPVTGHPWFLAVGDSISSGFTIDPSRAGVNSAWPLLLQSLLAGRGQDWSLDDIACPGETTASYTTGCHDRQVRASLGGLPQRDLALATIRAHLADLRLILVDLGSNDLLRALRGGGDPAAAAATLSTALTAIVGELHRAAPSVPLVVANYYNPVANALPQTEAEIAPVNAAVAEIVHQQGGTLVDFHAAINTRPAPDPDLCSWVDCAHIDVHPTVAGHRRLAQAALAVIPAG